MRVSEIWIAADPYPGDTEVSDIIWRSDTRIDHRGIVRLDKIIVTAVRDSMIDRDWAFYTGDGAEQEAKADARARLTARDTGTKDR